MGERHHVGRHCRIPAAELPSAMRKLPSPTQPEFLDAEVVEDAEILDRRRCGRRRGFARSQPPERRLGLRAAISSLGARSRSVGRSPGSPSAGGLCSTTWGSWARGAPACCIHTRCRRSPATRRAGGRARPRGSSLLAMLLRRPATAQCDRPERNSASAQILLVTAAERPHMHLLGAGRWMRTRQNQHRLDWTWESWAPACAAT